MLQIKYNEGFLDLGKDQNLEFEKENPLFILDDFYKEYSSPIIIKYSENNVSLLGAVFFDNYMHQRIKLDVELWDNNSFDCNVILVVDKNNANRRTAGKGDVNGFLLAGLSRFFYKIKYRFLNSLSFGGLRVFEKTYNSSLPNNHANTFSGVLGYLQHFVDTWNNNHDYIVAPVRNDIFNGDTSNSSGWLNNWIWEDLTVAYAGLHSTDEGYFSENEKKYAVAFPRLSYVFNQIFIENGFNLDASDLNGTNWDKLFLESLTPIYFRGAYGPFYDAVGIDLSTCISPEITCGDFILQVCKKYGWTLIDTGNNIFKLIALKNVKKLNKIDVTSYVADNIYTDFSAAGRITAFKNNFPSSEQFASGSSIDVNSGIDIETPVIDKSQLPSLISGDVNQISIYDNSRVFVYNDNKYYKVEIAATTNTRIWVPDIDNIYNYEPANNNVSIDSNVTTLPIYWTQYRKDAVTGVLYYGYFPLCKQSRMQNWGIRTLLFAGIITDFYYNTPSGPLTQSMSTDGTAYVLTLTSSTFQYPLLTSIRNNGNTDLLPWSNTYTHIKNGVDYGIINYWFKDWLNCTALMNIYEETINLPRYMLNLIQFDTILVIFNIPYLLLNYTRPYPYKGYILAKLKRIIYSIKDATPIITTNVYLKFTWEDEIDGADEDHSYEDSDGQLVTITYTHVKRAKPIIRAYYDPYGNNPIEQLGVMVFIRVYQLMADGSIYAPTDPYSDINYKSKMVSPVFNLASTPLIGDDHYHYYRGSIDATIDLRYTKSYYSNEVLLSGAVVGNITPRYDLRSNQNYIIIP